MVIKMKKAYDDALNNFHLPRFREIPDVGFYLEQTTRYISQLLEPLGEGAITGSMISNYVKKGLVTNPIKKRYDREQIAYLIFIALAKSVLSLDTLAVFIRMQKNTYSAEKTYDYFCTELENVLAFVFGQKQMLDDVGEDSTEEKRLLRSTIIAIAYKIYLERSFAAIDNSGNL